MAAQYPLAERADSDLSFIALSDHIVLKFLESDFAD